MLYACSDNRRKAVGGRVLCCTIFRAGGKKLLAKGHVISAEDAKMLETEGMNQIWVTELEDGEISEDDAVMQVASENRRRFARNPAGCRRKGESFYKPTRAACSSTTNCSKSTARRAW